MGSALRPLALSIPLLCQSCGSAPRQIPANADIVRSTNQAVAAGQSIPCGFAAGVLRITPIVHLSGHNPAAKFKTYGQVVDSDPKWEVELDVLPHDGKMPFQPGRRLCYIADVESVFGASPREVTGTYSFTFVWNVGVPGKSEFENFRATKK